YFDLTDEGAVKNAVRAIGNECPALDILVNNAGVSIERLMGMTSLAFVRETMDVNYLAQVQLAQLVSRYMMKKKSGSIVNVASVAGMAPEKGGLAYGSSKAAAIFSTYTMALELADYGIRVNAVSPGFIDTDMWEKRKDEDKEKVKSQTPLKRQGTPREVANAICFLASDLASYITGQNLIVDGGRKMGG
ncbi:MAG: SDR family oxidoreductase, partial [Selenomonadaceae bacterium]|nr:SDR family oxidoreductase [Selenomonadaceae bacterium]